MTEIELAQERLKQKRAELGIPEQPLALKRAVASTLELPISDAIERFLERYAERPDDPRLCLNCKGSGWRRVGVAGVVRCECIDIAAGRRRVAKIPEKYQCCSFETFDTLGVTSSVETALFFAKSFVQQYPLERRGICFHGPVGTGKTFLAVAMLDGLIQTKGVSGLFVHYPELLHMIRGSYDKDGQETEAEVLHPIYKAEALVIDEIGAVKTSEWTTEIMTMILNHRYSQDATTIVTTNFPCGELNPSQPRPASSPEPLSERLGARAYSRLYEMCRFVGMQGDDYRKRRPQR